jgi:hypothetical protein
MEKMATALSDHCGASALHVTRLEMNEFKAEMTEKVDAVAKSAQEIETTVKTIETERRVEKAGMTRSDRLFMLLLNSAVAILVAVIAYMAAK